MLDNEKYSQFSKRNLEAYSKVKKNSDYCQCITTDALEVVLYTLDTQYRLLHSTEHSRTDSDKYLHDTRTSFLEEIAGKNLIKKFKYNGHAGINKTKVQLGIDKGKNTHVGLVFFADYFSLNVILVNRNEKRFIPIKPLKGDLLCLIINTDNETFYPNITPEIFKIEDLKPYTIDFEECKTLTDFKCDLMETNIKNTSKIYKVETDGDMKSITNFKLADLQSMASANNIPLISPEGRKLRKAELYDILKKNTNF